MTLNKKFNDFNIRSSPEHLFNNEYKDIRMKMYEMKGF